MGLQPPGQAHEIGPEPQAKPDFRYQTVAGLLSGLYSTSPQSTRGRNGVLSVLVIWSKGASEGTIAAKGGESL